MIHLPLIIPCSIGIISANGSDGSSGRIVNQDFPHHLFKFTLFSHVDAHNSKPSPPPTYIKLQKKEESRMTKILVDISLTLFWIHPFSNIFRSQA